MKYFNVLSGGYQLTSVPPDTLFGHKSYFPWDGVSVFVWGIWDVKIFRNIPDIHEGVLITCNAGDIIIFIKIDTHLLTV